MAESLPFEEYAQYDGLALAELVRSGQVSPEELLETAIARLEAINPKINAISSTLYDAARSEITRDLPNGPFRGVPFLIKDLGFDMAGVASSKGSALFDGARATSDSTVVRRSVCVKYFETTWRKN